MFDNLSLRVKLVTPITVIVVVMLILLVFYATRSNNNLSGFLSEERMTTISQMAERYLDALDERNQIAGFAVASDPNLLELIDQWNARPGDEAIRQRILEFVQRRGRYFGLDNFTVVDAAGTVIIRTFDPQRHGDSALATVQISDGLQGRSGSFYDSLQGLPVVLTSAVPMEHDGAVIGVLVAIMNMDTNAFVDDMAKFFNGMVTVFQGRTRVATTVVGADGRRVVGTDVDRSVGDRVISGHSVMENVVVAGEPFYVFYLPLPNSVGTPVGIFSVGISNVAAAHRTRVMAFNLLVIGVVGFVLVTAVLLVVVIRMLRPIRLMARTLKDIATGDGDLTVRLPDRGGDEIGEASRYFNQTIGKIRDLVLGIKKQAGALSEIGSDLASNMTETASAMNEITATIQSIKSRVLNQSASVTETNATMEQVTVNIDKLNGHVDRQSNAVSQASSAIEQMMANIQSVTSTLQRNVENVRSLQESSEAGRSSLQEVAADIQEVGRESEGLLEINAVMENIASQTNLLSMNAAIEAAHAGEAGKGFAVVADEIRKLAESSSEQSKTIGTVLKKIKDSMDKITHSTDSVLGKFEAIDHGVRTVAEQEEVIRGAMEEQSQGSRQVLQASGQVSDITRQVKGGSQEMLEGSREVIQESKNLERATQEITNGINEMVVGAEEINGAVNSVNELSGRNRENIASLVRAVSQFKV